MIKTTILEEKISSDIFYTEIILTITHIKNQQTIQAFESNIRLIKMQNQFLLDI